MEVQSEAVNRLLTQDGRAPIGRFAVTGLVILGEYLLVSACFDVQPVAARGGAWAAFSHVGTAALVAVLMGIALTCLRGVAAKAPATVASRVRVSLLGWHAALYAAFLGLTWIMLGGARPPAGPATLWLGAWIVTGAASAGALLSALFQIRLGRPRLAVRVGAFACLVGGLAWQAGLLAEWLWDPLSHSTIAATAACLDALVPGAVRRPGGAVLVLADFAVNIDRTCSGFEGMGLAVVLTVAYWRAFRHELRFPHAFLLLPVSVALSWAGNVARLVSLMLLGAFVNARLAVGGFHSKAGWVMFCALALIVGTIGRRLRFFSRASKDRGEPPDNPTAAYLSPMLWVVGTALVTGLFAVTLDPFYGLRIVAAGCALCAYRRYYRQLQWGWSWLSVLAGALVASAWIVIPGGGGGASGAQALAAHASVAWIVIRAVGSATIVPMCEELAFRGYLLRRLAARDFTLVSLRAAAPLAILASSLVFGALHQRWVVASLAGVVYAVMLRRTGRMGDAVVAHSVSNALIAAWVIATGDVSQWVQ